MKFRKFFENIGNFWVHNKSLPICLTFLIALLFSLGMISLEMTVTILDLIKTNPQDLWVDKGGRTFKEQEYFEEKFGAFFRINQFIFKPKDESKNLDMFDKKYLNILYGIEVHSFFIKETIRTRNTTMKGKYVILDHLCYKPISDKGCLVESPIGYWKNNITDMNSDPNIKETALCIKSRDGSYVPCSDENGVPVIKTVIFGGINNVKSAYPCSPNYTDASALMVTFLLNNDKFTADEAAQWEKDVYIDTLKKFNNKELNFVDHLNSEKAEIVNEAISMANDNGIDFEVSYLSERSIPDELSEETDANVFVVVISYTIMFFYISFAIGSFPSKVHTGFLVGVCGIVLVIISITSGIGLASIIGFKISMISMEVVPFLILAIGVDNMFIIAGASKRFNYLDVPEQFALTLGEVGPSITTAAICEFLAFVVGIFTNIPALQSFCIIAAFSLIFNYIFQMTAFVAFLAWDEERRRNNNYDIVFCLRSSNNSSAKDGRMMNLFEKYYVPFLFNKFCTAIVFIFFIFFFAISIYGATQLELGLEQQTSLIENGSTYKYFNDLAKYGEAGPPAYLVLKNVNYRDQNDLDNIREMSDSLSKLSTVLPPIVNWVSAFQQFVNPSGNWVDACGTNKAIYYTFEEQVRTFQKIKIDSKCCQYYGICGEQFEKDIVFDENGMIASSRLRFQHQPAFDSKAFIKAFQQTREVVDYYSGQFRNPESSVYTYSLFYIFFEQYEEIRGLAIQSVLLAVGIVFATIVILKNARTAIVTSLCVFVSSFDLIGLTYLMNITFGGYGVQVNAVSVVNLISAVGLSVEFCVHLMIAFMDYEGSREERSKNALAIMGSSILVGIVITKFLGIVVLAFAPSTIFKLYYFRMYLCIIILGAFHGLMFLPCLLRFIGPVASRKKSVYEKGSIDLGLLKKES